MELYKKKLILRMQDIKNEIRYIFYKWSRKAHFNVQQQSYSEVLLFHAHSASSCSQPPSENSSDLTSDPTHTTDSENSYLRNSLLRSDEQKSQESTMVIRQNAPPGQEEGGEGEQPTRLSREELSQMGRDNRRLQTLYKLRKQTRQEIANFASAYQFIEECFLQEIRSTEMRSQWSLVSMVRYVCSRRNSLPQNRSHILSQIHSKHPILRKYFQYIDKDTF